MTVHPVYTPATLEAADLDAHTVGPTELLDTLVDRIRSAAADGARPHTLLIAPRGGGKTHTLHLAVGRALAGGVGKTILPVLIPEDSLAIGSYLDLLVEISLAVDPELAEQARAWRRDGDTIGIESAILTAAQGRMILLAMENLDRIFDALDTAGQGSLRAWVETSASVLVLATAPALFAGVSSRNYPWYGSFIVEELPGLSVDDAARLLSRAARRRSDGELVDYLSSTQGRQRLSELHRLLGGTPRLWRILSEGTDAAALDELYPAVEHLLDLLSPYYQQQLWQLPAGEQRLVVELARGRRPRTVGDLATAVGVSNQSAATALGRLARTGWVASAKAAHGDRRTSWYDLTDRQLGLHLAYRHQGGRSLRLAVDDVINTPTT